MDKAFNLQSDKMHKVRSLFSWPST